MKNVLTIAGSDSSGGAGIQADLKTFAALGGYGMSVITAVTAQNTLGVSAIEEVPCDMIKKQIEAVFEDIRVDGVKIGMLPTVEAAEAVADELEKYRPRVLIVDPVMISTSGSELSAESAVKVLCERILPLAEMVTPNLYEAERLSGVKINSIYDMGDAAQIIGRMGPRQVLIKGGHFCGESSDDLLYNGRTMTILEGKRIENSNTHGTGCSLSSAICINIAKGMDVVSAVGAAKKYVAVGIEHGLDIGNGSGPIHHFYDLWSTSEPNVEIEYKSVEKENVR